MHHAQGFIYTLCTSRLSGRGLILRPLLLHAVLELLHHLHTHGTALRRTHHAAPRHKAATKLPQRPFARVLSLAHLGARPEVAVRLKRQAVFHGPVLVLAARPPDHAVHDLPAPGRARLAASRPGSAPRVGRLTHILVFKRPGHVALSKNPARTTAEPCQRGSSKRFILVKVFLNCPTRLCGKRQGDSIAHRFESEIHGDSLGYGA